MKISGPVSAPFSLCLLFIIFLRIIQAASNSFVSAIGVTSLGSTATR